MDNRIYEQIIDQTDIVAVIGSYLSLEKKGNSYVGLCPFHDDKNPSLSVAPAKRVFKCFACGVAGNVISFVSKFEKISYLAAARKLGKALGIALALTPEEVEREKNRRYYEIMTEAAEFYHYYLTATEAGRPALAYLAKRGIDSKAVAKFQIGLAGQGRDELFTMLTAKGYLPIDIAEVGLASERGDRWVDVFQGRIMFPLCDLSGAVTGFSGRKYLPGDETSKYLNTSETLLFKKGEQLYNYHGAKSVAAQTGTIYLTEGFMDVIAFSLAGYDNAVAGMGTALTPSQATALARAAHRVVIAYDGDAAGTAATKAAVKLLSGKTKDLEVLAFPDDLDPDDFFRAKGRDQFTVFADHPQNAYDYLYKQAIAGFDPASAATLKPALAAVKELLSLIADPALRDFYVAKASELFKVKENALAVRVVSAPAPQPEASIAELQANLKRAEQAFEEAARDLIYYALTSQERAEALLADDFETTAKKLSFEMQVIIMALNMCQKKYEIVKVSDARAQLDEQGKELLADILAHNVHEPAEFERCRNVYFQKFTNLCDAAALIEFQELAAHDVSEAELLNNIQAKLQTRRIARRKRQAYTAKRSDKEQK